jgi:Na+-driven multidrug efflux pump
MVLVGVLRSVGLQLACSIVSFIGFYVVGLTLAIVLMFKTSLSLYGMSS